MLRDKDVRTSDIFLRFSEALQDAEVQANRIQALDEARTRLFADISHELLEPLALIIDPLKSLLHGACGPLNPEASEHIQQSLRNSQRLLRVVNQVSDLSRLDAGNVQLEREILDIFLIIDEAVDTFSPLASRLGIHLHWTPGDEPCLLPVDRNSMEKILANLLSNALRFTPSGGDVELRVRQSDTHAEVVIHDTGAGIPPDKMAHRFGQFHQAEDLADARDGSGIGLALVKELVHLHEGSIEIDSDPGRGTTFTVSLPFDATGAHISSYGDPVLPVDAGDARDRFEDSFADDKDRTTVLVAEDHAAMRSLIKRMLEPSYRVQEASDGVDALNLIREELPDAVITDVMMPNMDGMDLCRQIRSEPMTADIPVIFLSAKAQADSQLEGMLAGADAYVTKPFQGDVLWALVGNLIAKRHRLRTLTATVADPRNDLPENAQSSFELQVRRVVDAHISDPTFSVEQLAAEMASSPSRLYRRLRDEVGVAPNDLIRIARMERSAQLLADHSGTLSEVAYAVGFNSLSYFGRCFRAHFGESPSKYVNSRP